MAVIDRSDLLVT